MFRLSKRVLGQCNLIVQNGDAGSSKMVAGIKSGEVIESGESDGWQGSLEELSQVEKILSKFNIFYVNDFAGEWGHKRVQ